jgi:Na+/proline symporter
VNPLVVGVAVYVLLQLGIGLWVARRVHSQEDYLLAGRSLGLGMASFTIFATWFGAETCVGAAGQIFEHGLTGGGAEPFGYALCLLLMGAVFAAALWRRGLLTVADLMRQRFGPGAERFTALLLVPTSIMWAGAQIRAFGQVLAVTAGVDPDVAIAAAAGIVMLYTVSGGLLADVITDLVQGIALIIGLGLLLVAVVTHLGGVDAALAAVDPSRLAFGTSSPEPLKLLDTWAIPVCGSLVAQELVSRVLACRSANVARRATLVGGLIYLVVGLIPAFIGLVGPQLVPDLAHPEQLLGEVARIHLGGVAYVAFVGALISAILSTVDSALLSAASLTSQNLVLPLRPGLSDAAKLRAARLCVLVFSALAFLLARAADHVHELVEAASAFGTGGLFVVFVLGISTRLGGPHSALAALGVGLITWLAGRYVLDWTAPFLCSMAAAALAFAVVAVLEARFKGGPVDAAIRPR